MTSRFVLKSVLDRIGSELVCAEFERKSPSIFTRRIRSDFLGWLGLNYATRRAMLEINPVVGVRSQEVESIVARLQGDSDHRYVPPTISVSLGYILPQESYTPWLFTEPLDQDVVRDLVNTLVSFAIPFMEQSASINAIAHLLADSRYSHRESSQYRLPVAYMLLGKVENSVAACKSGLADLGSRTDPAALRYRAFCKALLLEMHRAP